MPGKMLILIGFGRIGFVWYSGSVAWTELGLAGTGGAGGVLCR